MSPPADDPFRVASPPRRLTTRDILDHIFEHGVSVTVSCHQWFEIGVLLGWREIPDAAIKSFSVWTDYGQVVVTVDPDLAYGEPRFT
jgi:hypothetical protein